MAIISKRMQEQIRKYQQETGETAKCFSGISLTKELWQKLSEKYEIPGIPLENDLESGLVYWESKNGQVRLLTKGNPNESIVNEVTVYARPDTIIEIEKILNIKGPSK